MVGAIRKEENNLLNKKFDKLEVIEYLGGWNWRCVCDCGKELTIRTNRLKNGRTCCGCTKSEKALYRKRTFRRWESMRDKKLLSEEFNDFNKFNSYIYNELKPEKEEFRVYRIDLSKPFERGNIKTKTETHEKDFYGTKFRWCTGCEKYITLSERFWANNKGKTACKQCVYFVQLKQIGVNREKYYKMIKNCNERCEICKGKLSSARFGKTTCIDHCHKTNKARGVLCNNCNAGLGSFKDNTEFLKNAINYLKRGDTIHKYKPWSNKKAKIDIVCPITGGEENLVCDHNHNTNFIRGNIDNYINMGIGSFRDSIENLENAIIYLEKERN